tara:strand:- start:222 stop:656 length:435 start_codon:yes stop_codon:yes gene_type:complete
MEEYTKPGFFDVEYRALSGTDVISLNPLKLETDMPELVLIELADFSLNNIDTTSVAFRLYITEQVDGATSVFLHKDTVIPAKAVLYPFDKPFCFWSNYTLSISLNDAGYDIASYLKWNVYTENQLKPFQLQESAYKGGYSNNEY